MLNDHHKAKENQLRIYFSSINAIDLACNFPRDAFLIRSEVLWLYNLAKCPVSCTDSLIYDNFYKQYRVFYWSGDKLRGVIVGSKRNQNCHRTCYRLINENCKNTYAGPDIEHIWQSFLHCCGLWMTSAAANLNNNYNHFSSSPFQHCTLHHKLWCKLAVK